MATQQGHSEPSEPLTYKTWILKVSIHCEGCERKVKRVLHSIEGVYVVSVERKLQKVIVTGNIEVETLIKKLNKSGRHAELWPEVIEHKEKKSKKSKKKGKNTDPETNTQEIGQAGSETEKQDVKTEVIPDSVNVSDGGFTPIKIGGGGVKPENGTPGNQSPVAEEIDGGGKKKKNNSVTVVEPSSVGAPACTGTAVHFAGPPQVNLSPPRHYGYQYPPPYYYVPPPVYNGCYSMLNPTTRSYNTTSYCASKPLHSYSYSTYSGPEMESSPSDWESCPRKSLDSFELLSDENPNGCSVI